ncbi:MAG: hypothetical protein ACON5F_08640 [Jejuia sp.]
MKHSKLVPYVQFVNQRLTILEIATLVIKFYQKLSKKDSYYEQISIVSEKASLYDFIKVKKG